MAEDRQRIVVGVDGSESSKQALRWAVRQAELTGGSVEAVTAWYYPATYGLAPVAVDGADLAGDAKRVLTEALAEVGDLAPRVRVEPLIAEGHAATVLLAAAQGADLLVVGSRGHGGFTSALVGSVSLYCVLHARCPVLVVRDGHQDARVSQ